MEGRVKTIGILGGMGPLASGAFFTQLVNATEAARDQDHLPVVMVSLPTIPDRTAFLLGTGPDPRPALVNGARQLRACGADLLVIPCNTANVWIDEIARAAQIESISWLDVTAQAVAQTGARRVGLLATSGTLQTGIYQNLIDGRGIEVLVPDAEGQAAVMDAIYALKGGAVPTATMRRLENAMKALATSGAESLVLACTELPIVLHGQAPPLPVIDPAFHVAREAIRAAGGTVRKVTGEV